MIFLTLNGISRFFAEPSSGVSLDGSGKQLTDSAKIF